MGDAEKPRRDLGARVAALHLAWEPKKRVAVVHVNGLRFTMTRFQLASMQELLDQILLVSANAE